MNCLTRHFYNMYKQQFLCVGNWSGYSSSNRQSLDSDVVVKMEQASASQTSLGNDSGRCSPTTDPDDHR